MRTRLSLAIALIGLMAALAAPVTLATGGGHEPVTICHKPGTPAEHTIVVDNDSVLQAHLRHGDTLGPCSSTVIPTPTASATPSAPTPTPTPITPSSGGRNDTPTSTGTGPGRVTPPPTDASAPLEQTDYPALGILLLALIGSAVAVMKFGTRER